MSPLRLLRPLAPLAALTLARPAAAEPPRKATFALVVTHNGGAGVGRPDLHYADDDGAKYYEVFRTLAPEDGAALLTRFDRDTERLFPNLKEKTKPPTRANVRAAALALADKARAAAAAGREVDFYFVFAGHGDVDRGRGFVELEDGPFTADDLEALLRGVPAARAHVVLDSCNSFFMVAGRKPGGRHFATPEDATRGLGKRLPNVGIFLSTSADGEVFEWSELGSGVFSHAVRSGLAGAADADADGSVSYRELRAFVDVSAAGVKNPRYRPRVFARGPGGRDDASFFDTARASGVTLNLAPGPELRLTVRDADEQPWVDLHKEAGASLSLRLPARWGARASVDLTDVGAAGPAARGRVTLDLPSPDARVELASLAPATASPLAARGPGDIFRSLYAQPFGPHALASYEVELARRPAPVYGISGDEQRRVELMLRQVAEFERDSIITTGWLTLSAGAVASSFGTYVGASAASRGDDNAVDFVGAGASVAIMGGLGALLFLSPNRGDELHAEFIKRRSLPNRDDAHLVADMDRKLFLLAESHRRERLLMRWLGAGTVAAGAGFFAATQLAATDEQRRRNGPEWYSALVGASVLGVGAFSLSFVKHPVERTVDFWKSDPGLQRLPRASVTPTFGVGSLGLQGVF